MSRFKQRVDEHSSIIPSGFTGYIVRNSNIIIDKSYIQKGTSFLNVFDNSNALIKDCGTPYPTVQSQVNQYIKLQTKLTSQLQTRKLPFWVHYNFEHDSRLNFVSTNPDYIKVGMVHDQQVDQTVKEYRQNLIAQATATGDDKVVPQDETYKDKYVINSDKLIQRQVIDNGQIQTDEIDSTVSGTYYLSGAVSSIRSVFPLTSSYKLNNDSPQLILNLKQRSLTPILLGNQKVYLNGIIKTDSYGYKIQNQQGTNKSVTLNTDDYVPSALSNYVHKYIAETSNSLPIYQKDEDGNFIQQKISSDDGGKSIYFIVDRSKTTSDESTFSNFIMGPYLKSTISYIKYDNDGNYSFQNSGKGSQLSFYFKYNSKTYSLFEIINGKINDVQFSSLTGTDKNLYNNFIQSKVSYINALSGTTKLSSKKIYFDVITKKNTTSYQPEGISETCKFVGLKYKNTDVGQYNFEEDQLYSLSSSTPTNITTNAVAAYLRNQDMFTGSAKYSKDKLLSSDFYYANIDSLNLYTSKSGFFINSDESSLTNSQMTKEFYKLIKYSVQQDYSLTFKILKNVAYKEVITTNQTKTISGNVLFTLDDDQSNIKIINSYTKDLLSEDYIKNGSYQRILDAEIINEGDLSAKINSTSTTTYSNTAFTKEINGFSDTYNFYNDTTIVLPTSINSISIDKLSDEVISQINDEVSMNITLPQESYDYTETKNGKPITSGNIIDNFYSYFDEHKIIKINSYYYKLIEEDDDISSLPSSFIDQDVHVNWTSKGYYKSCDGITKVVNNGGNPITTGNGIFLSDYVTSSSSNIRIASSSITNTNKCNSGSFSNYTSYLSNLGIIGRSFIQVKQVNSETSPITLTCNYYSSTTIKSLVSPNIVLKSVDEEDGKTFGLKQFFTKSQASQNFIVNGYDDYDNVMINPGVTLNIYNTNSDSTNMIQLNINVALDNSITVDTSTLLIKGDSEYNLVFYYDKNCSNPVQLGQYQSGQYSLYSHTNGKKTYVQGNKGVIQGNEYISYNYQKIYKYSYLRSYSYQYEWANDWYNVNTYINYNSLVSNFDDVYTIGLKSFSGSSLSQNSATYYFLDQYFVDDVNSYQYSDQPIRKHIGYSSTNQILISNNDVSENYLKIGSLFTTSKSALSGQFNNSQNNFSYKLFSFNFKIPKYGWDKLNQIIYAQNPYFKTDILTNGQSSLIDTYTTPTSALKTFKESSNKTFNGQLSFLYMVLDNRVVQQIVGSGNYGDGGYVDANGVYHTGSKISKNNVQYGGVAQKSFSTAYNAQFIRIPFIAKFKLGGSKLDVTSTNQTLAFTADFTNSAEVTNNGTTYLTTTVTLNGLFTTTKVNGILHNIIIPTMTLYVAKTVDNSKIFISPSLWGANIYKKGDNDSVVKTVITQYNMSSNYSSNPTLYSKIYSKLYYNLASGQNSINSTFSTDVTVNDLNSGIFTNSFWNMAPNSQYDQNYYFYTWIPLCTINFGCSGVSTYLSTSSGRNVVYWTKLRNALSHIIAGNAGNTVIDNPFTYDVNNTYKKYVISSYSSSPIYDAQPLIIPSDISTNLFYYKGSPDGNDSTSTQIKNQDEVIIVNARKMYSEANQIDQKPIGGNLQLELKNLQDTQIVLTSLIKGSQEQISKYFNEVHVFVNDNFEYSRTNDGSNHECRYTDAHSQGLQWKLFELKDGVVFSSINDFETPLTQISNGSSVSGNVISVPSKLMLTLSGLVFQQQCRCGVSFDNINNISFDQRVFDGDMFGSDLKPGASLSGRFQLLQIGSVDPAGSAVPSAIVNGSVQKNSNYYLIKRPMSDLQVPSSSFGGTNYYNDFYQMKINSNAANKWETYSQKSQFSKLLIYPDYNPAADSRIIGIPYLNQEGTLILKQNVSTGTSTGGTGTVQEIESVASLVKIAEDIAYVNPVLNVESQDDYGIYPSSVTMSSIAQNSTFESSGIDGVYIWSFNISGSFDNYDDNIINTGVKYLDIDSGIFTDIISGITTSEPNKFGIYFDGLVGSKQIVIKNTGCGIVLNNIGYSQPFYILGLDKSFVKLIEQDKKGVFYGTVSLQMSQNNPNSSGLIQIHNFKLPTPILTSIGVSFTNQQKQNLNFNGFYPITDDIWSKQVFFNGETINTIATTSKNYLRLYSSSQPGSDLSGNSTVLTDDDGEITGLLLTLKIPGIKLFKQAGMKYFLQSKQTVTLSSSQMLETYKKVLGIKKVDSSGNQTSQYYLGDEYNPNAVVGTSVLSGTITNTYNYVTTTYMPLKKNIGRFTYRYNPIDDDKFQLQVITKPANGKFNKSLYYINRHTNVWYNMAFYKYSTESKDGLSTTSKIGFILNNVDGDTLSDLTSESQQIFRCQVHNDSFVDGTTISCGLGYSDDLLEWNDILFPKTSENKIISLMKDWKSLYTISFDKCSRISWNCKYSNDPQNLANSEQQTQDQYENRRNIDLFKVSDALNGLQFSNTNGSIKLFANAELNSILSNGIAGSILSGNYETIPTSGLPLYNLYIGDDFTSTYSTYSDVSSQKITTSQLRNNNSASVNADERTIYTKLRQRLIGYYPRRILYNDSTNNYILKKRTSQQLSPRIKSVQIMAKNIMILSSPNLYYKPTSGVAYSESYYESLGAVNDYRDFFGNPQHRLPPVSYSNRLLDSDYATFVYDNSQKYQPLINYNDQNSASMSETVIYNYENVPSRISFAWGNSQITRSQTVSDSTYSSKLYWNKSAFNEYTSEVGSVYNFTDSQHVTNVVSIQTGSITDRQCVLMPVISSPLVYQKRSDESGVVKVIDSIIATSALGYNQLGYPKNGILSYNTNGNIFINSKLKNYIFIQQSENSSDCTLGTTIQKPVVTEAVQQNIESLGQKFKFLPNPTISVINSDETLADEGVQQLIGGTAQQNLTTSVLNIMFFNGNKTGIVEQNYKKLSYYNEVDLEGIQQYEYPDSDSVVSLDSDLNRTTMFIFNPYSVTSKAGSDGSTSIVDTNVMNVFYDESQLQTLSSELQGASVATSLTTLKCFGYDGQLIDVSNNTDAYNAMVSGLGETFVTDILDEYDSKCDTALSSVCFKAPIFGVIWGMNNGGESYISDVSTYKQNLLLTLSDYQRGRSAVIDQYMGVNLSSIKFKINEEDISSAPTYIEIQLLKYDSTKATFYWLQNASLDLDITESYQTVYDYDNPGDRYVQKTFINDGNNYANNVYGIKFKIISIVPQSSTVNACKIGNIQIYVSNILNTYGSSRSVEDVYIRRADANYADAYSIKCAEYVWRLPNSKSQWQSVLTSLQNDTSLETQNSIDLIKSYVSGFINGSVDNTLVDDYILTTNFSRVNSYFISNNTNQNNQISQVLSDNYLVDSDIQISWKYIDYVYIYYSCYSFNAKQLLDMYFGDKIYAAVRTKLLNNINNLNANSAFGQKYKFGGGIAVQKQFALNTQTKSQAFNWKADVRTDQLDTYQDTYATDWTKTDVYTRSVTGTSTYATGHGFGNHCYLGTSYSYSSAHINSSTTTASVHLAGTTKLASSSTRNYLGSTLQNAKYSSVDNWTKSFSPRQIKYKIN